MNKEINPLLAFAIIATVLLLITFLFWTSSEQKHARVGAYFLQLDAENNLTIQVDDTLYRVEDRKEIHDYALQRFGVGDIMGNVDFFANNDILVRRGSSDYGLRAYFSLFAFDDDGVEKNRTAVVQGVQGGEGQLLRCKLSTIQCQSVNQSNTNIPWRYRAKIDRKSDQIYISDGQHHQLMKFSATGELLATRSSDLKFPKRVRQYGDRFYVTDTNNHRIEFFESNIDLFGQSIEKHTVVSEAYADAKWALDVVNFEQHWWVINKQDGMRGSTLQRFNENWQWVDALILPEAADLSDMLVYQQKLLVTDIQSGDILQFNQHGEALENLSFEPIRKHFNTLTKKRQHYTDLNNYAIALLVALFVFGFIIAIFIGRKHDKENPESHRRPLMKFKAHAGDGNTMLISNIEVIPNKRVLKHFGLVQGSTVRAKHAGKDILAGFKNLFGGELRSYTDLLQESREEALQRMSEQADTIGANAILNVRFSTSSIAAGASEILAYGTAVLVEDK